ncbi:MAG: PCRF domain-containing protein, partial [Candidatus Shikimatogenerans sp. JK-2022]|nr:PCRF domain-containing protein [Candidatus Shikimatogenerans bostrichidophilus]
MKKKIKIIIKNLKKLINIKKIKNKYKKIKKTIIKYNNNIKKIIILNKKKNKYKKLIIIYKNIFKNYNDIKLLYNYLFKENTNTNIKDEINIYYNNIKNLFNSIYLTILPKNYKLNSIVQINSGCGGKDSQNWVKILSKMYILWAKKKKFKYNIINNIKLNEINNLQNITLEIYGKYSYGFLINENGIHKLIRISPYNKKRHTSYASVNVIPININNKNNNNIYINSKDIILNTFKSSGSGGQNVNKVETGVRIIHKPTNLYIKSTNTRSQLQNKKYAFKKLKSKLLNIQNKEKEKKKKINIIWGNIIRIYILHPYKLIK